MRILLIGALCVSLVGCACPPSTRTTAQKACTSNSCLHRSAVAPAEVKSVAFKPSRAMPATKPATADSKAVVATKVETPGQPSDDSDSVLRKAKSTIASKMEDPPSAQFVDMKRAMRPDVGGHSIDTICGHVKGKTASGEATGERPFLYFVKNDVAFVDTTGTTGSVAADAYRNICTKADASRGNFSQ